MSDVSFRMPRFGAKGRRLNGSPEERGKQQLNIGLHYSYLNTCLTPFIIPPAKEAEAGGVFDMRFPSSLQTKFRLPLCRSVASGSEPVTNFL
jgi:hypothetical protein